MSVVGENIRLMRLNAGITQEELALRSGLSQGYINHLEMGKRKYTQKSLELIADALSIPIIEFFKEDETAEPVALEVKAIFRDKQAVAKELRSVLKDLPEAVASHYLTLMKLEREMLKDQKRHL